MPQNTGIDQPSYELTEVELIKLKGELAPAEFFILMLIRIRAEEQKAIEISDTSLGELLGYTTRHARRCLQSLEDKGLIDINYGVHSVTAVQKIDWIEMSRSGSKCPEVDRNVQEVVQDNYPESAENSLPRARERTRTCVRPSGYNIQINNSLSILNCNEFVEFCQEKTRHYKIPIQSWVDFFNPEYELRRLRFEQFVAEFEKREREEKIDETPQQRMLRARQQEFLAKSKRSRK